MKISRSQIHEKLKIIISEQPFSIRAHVAQVALEYEGDHIERFFSDLFKQGCQSGMISCLIYYADTHQFYDTYYHEIEDIRYQLEDELGISLQPKGDLKNWYAWLAYEETAKQIADELEIVDGL